MTRYKVILNENCDYTIYVDAANEEEAAEKAEETFVAGSILDFECEVHAREVAYIEVVNENNAPIAT